MNRRGSAQAVFRLSGNLAEIRMCARWTGPLVAKNHSAGARGRRGDAVRQRGRHPRLRGTTTVIGIVGADLSGRIAVGSRSDRCTTLGLPSRNRRFRLRLNLLLGRRSDFSFLRQSQLPQACHPGAYRELFRLVLLHCPDRVTRAILFGLCRGGRVALNNCHRTSSSLARLLRFAPDDCVAHTERRGSQTRTPRPAEPHVGLKPQALPVHPWSRRHGSMSAAN